MEYLKREALRIRQWLRKDFDHIMAIDGDERLGKSTLAYHWCKLIDPKFPGEDAWKICYDYTEFYQAIERAKKYSAILLDEGAEMFYKLDFMRVESKEAKKCLMRIGAKNLFICIVIPNFWDLDKYFTNHRVRTWCHVKARGVFRFHVRKKRPYEKDAWYEPKWEDTYPPLDKEDKKIYLERKERFLRPEIVIIEDRKKRRDIILHAIVKLRNEGKTFREIAQLFGCSWQAIQQYYNKAKRLYPTIVEETR